MLLFPLKATSSYATFFEGDDPLGHIYSVFNGVTTNVQCLVPNKKTDICIV